MAQPPKLPDPPPPHQPPAPQPPAEEKLSPGAQIGFGLFLIAVGVGLFLYFASFEETGGNIRIHALVALIYNTLGKWGLLAIFGGGGVILFGCGIAGLVNARSKPIDDDDLDDE